MKPKLVLIEWVDSTQPISGWRFMGDMPDLEIVHCLSVGWLVNANKSVKMLAPNMGNTKSKGNAQASGFIRIPVAAIVREVALQEVG